MHTARLELRPIVEDDLDALVELDGFREVRDAIDPFREHIPDDPVQRRAYERRFVGNAGFVAAVERESGRLLGWFQYELAGDGSGELELGYRLRPDAWGQGLATEGAQALLADALERPEVTRVFVLCRRRHRTNYADRLTMGISPCRTPGDGDRAAVAPRRHAAVGLAAGEDGLQRALIEPLTRARFC